MQVVVEPSERLMKVELPMRWELEPSDPKVEFPMRVCVVPLESSVVLPMRVLLPPSDRNVVFPTRVADDPSEQNVEFPIVEQLTLCADAGTAITIASRAKVSRMTANLIFQAIKITS